jgi:hypothetical protein
MSEAAPTSIDVIVACDGDAALYYLDAHTGALLKEVEGHGVGTGDGFRAAGMDEPWETCGDGTFNHSLTRVAGWHTVGSNTVPAYYDLATKQVVDVEPLPDTSGFAHTPTVGVMTAAYSPFSDDLWYITTTELSSAFTIHGSLGGKSYSQQYPDGGKYTSGTCRFSFTTQTAPPNVLCGSNIPAGYALLSIDGTVKQLPIDAVIPNPVYLNPKLLPSNDRSITTIRRSDDGKSAAFIDEGSNMLWTVRSDGASPTRVGPVKDHLGGIVKFGRVLL